MLTALLRSLLGSAARASRLHAEALRRAWIAYGAGNHPEAHAAAQEAARALPESPQANYALGVIACALGKSDAAAAALERAVGSDAGNALYIAALANVRLLQEREDDAHALYRRAFPDVARRLDALPERSSPWKKAHPDWLRPLRRLSLPRVQDGKAPDLCAATPSCLLNWGLLLIRFRRVRAGTDLIEQALHANAGYGYGHAVLALVYTLDRAWPQALAAAQAARSLGADTLPGEMDLCVVSAQLGMGKPPHELDPLFDWRPLHGPNDDSYLERLPAIQGLPIAPLPADALVHFVACDTAYLEQHAVALAHSIRAQCGDGAIHLHLFEPTAQTWASLDKLRLDLSPLPLSVTWETVAFDDYSGKSLYCACARFVRLYQMVRATGNRVVMLDADSLVRGDLASALAGAGDIGLVRAEHEPPWHYYLGGFCAFRRSPVSLAFLRELGALLAFNLPGGRARRYLDQLALYICARRAESEGVCIEHLPIGKFCDTLFTEDALVWSVTQNKDADSPFARYKREVLARVQRPERPVACRTCAG
jgi:tetratricopeptide (TPR) repeat protein